VISLAQSANFSTGDPVSGFGVPAGATVSSVAGNQVTIGQPATASTTVVSGGTLQGDYKTIAMASTVGIVPGMSVTGPYLAAGAQVVGVTASSVTLGAPVDPMQFFTPIASASGQLPQDRASVYFATSLSSLFTVGSLIASPVLPVTARARITGFRNSRMAIGKNVTEYKIAAISVAALPGAGNSTWTIYNEITPSAGTYTFSATNQTYTFRADNFLPYGSFPGVGTFFT
jgi:hypothetical protein